MERNWKYDKQTKTFRDDYFDASTGVSSVWRKEVGLNVTKRSDSFPSGGPVRRIAIYEGFLPHTTVNITERRGQVERRLFSYNPDHFAVEIESPDYYVEANYNKTGSLISFTIYNNSVSFDSIEFQSNLEEQSLENRLKELALVLNSNWQALLLEGRKKPNESIDEFLKERTQDIAQEIDKKLPLEFAEGALILAKVLFDTFTEVYLGENISEEEKTYISRLLTQNFAEIMLANIYDKNGDQVVFDDTFVSHCGNYAINETIMGYHQELAQSGNFFVKAELDGENAERVNFWVEDILCKVNLQKLSFDEPYLFEGVIYLVNSSGGKVYLKIQDKGMVYSEVFELPTCVDIQALRDTALTEASAGWESVLESVETNYKKLSKSVD